MPGDSTKTRLLQELRIDRESGADEAGWWRGWPALLLLVLLCLGAAAVVAFMLLRAPRFEVEAAVAVAPSGGAGSTAILQATGYVTARREATVSAQITGALTAVLIEEGEHVTAGQVLAHLDDSAQRAARAQAQAQLMAARALLVQFQAQLEQARRDNQRNQDLIDRKLVSQQALETTQTQVATLAAQVESQQKQVELAQATLQGAQVQLDYTTVRAPFSGVIVAKAAQAGEIISPISAGGGFTRTGVGTIVDMDSLEIEVDVNEAYINRVQPGQSAQAVLDAYPDWTIAAHVIAIIPTADRSKATVKVRVAIEHKDPRILPDMGVRVSFLEQAAERNSHATDAAGGVPSAPPAGVLVPASAIVERGGNSVVFVIDGARARARPVTPGQTHGELRQVDGIAAGTSLVRSPPQPMNDGATIVISKQ
ncbi:MAG TPA: efflux RND transporter periplasmic adaptor subunit [Steroidobacteraceae bacterium]|jgi:RND family efflux transporter MFP subunit|nr:efflux RND transporter periplasmic adaptor subunit [Steroidobacteraceae bacterium]